MAEQEKQELSKEIGDVEMDKFSFKGNMLFAAFWFFFSIPIIILQWWLINTFFLTTILNMPTLEQAVFWVATISFGGFILAFFIRNIFRGV